MCLGVKIGAKIGLTGGIGSGKSTIGRIFSTLGIPVYDADKAAKTLMNTDPLKKKISTQFGSHYYNPQGDLRRTALAKVVFSNPKALETLNNLVHPLVLKDFEQWQQTTTSPLLPTRKQPYY